MQEKINFVCKILNLKNGGGEGRKNGRTGRNPSVSKNPELYPERSALREIGAKNLNSHFLMNREPLIPDQRVPDKFPG